ncbi:hypothetical protein JRO89_XS14G0038700 [Xanthoceras sorbifolium]|uniref:MLO-like protein n=2 Tax=Magnoliopsida TaxID=3398 RepID=A0ABQ8H3N0_9ROSI|nr:hypothetical protein JRO89_XS14G0038700 [Xanthoceras sorbifolium]
MAEKVEERTLEETPTWAVAVVCFVLIAISIALEHLIHIVGKWLNNRHKRALFEALEKVKAVFWDSITQTSDIKIQIISEKIIFLGFVCVELMLMGFISLLLTMGQGIISEICVSKSIANSWHPCSKEEETSKYGSSKDITIGRRRLLSFFYSATASTRRSLAAKKYDKCAEKARLLHSNNFSYYFFVAHTYCYCSYLKGIFGQVAFVSAYGIHQLHIFIFVLAVFHVLYCITTLALGRTKMKKWKGWEDETRTIEYQYYNDPERFRFARDTSFGRRHLNIWSSSSISLWILCFFRQFFGSVTKVDYLTLRHGFIMAHLAPGSETKFDFQKYISRSLEQDFVVVVGITPVLWFIAMLFLLTNTHVLVDIGWMAYLWLPFIPLIIILLVGTKLQVIITKLGLRIQERGDVVKGAPVVQPGDDLFWFGRPRFILFLIHVVLFQNAFQLAFFIWSVYEFSIKSCYHKKIEDIIIRISMGILIQILCSYVTLPLYALVTQMGSTMKPTIFNERVAAALKNWHHTAKKNTKHGRQSESNTPYSSRPATPTHGMSPVHLLHNYPNRSVESYHASHSPRRSSFDNDKWDPESLRSPRQYQNNYSGSLPSPRASDSHHGEGSVISEQEMVIQEPTLTQLPPGPGPIRTQHEIHNTSSGFSFAKRSQ